MNFGKVDNPEAIDFTLTNNHISTNDILGKKQADNCNVYVGCAKWSKQDLKGFYPRGTKDELTYYATQFNSIELNATFYNFYSTEQFENWRDKTPEDFRFIL